MMASGVKGGFHRVFVYGTLKTGEPNHHELTNPQNGVSSLVGSAWTRHRFPLVVATSCYIPFLMDKRGVGHEIRGEVYEVDEQMLQFLDQFEVTPAVYQRVELEVILDTESDGEQTGPLTCYGYTMGRFPASWLNLPHLESYRAANQPREYNEDDIDTLEGFMRRDLTGSDSMENWISGDTN